MNAPTLTGDLHRTIARLEAEITRLSVELDGARQVIAARRARDAQEVAS